MTEKPSGSPPEKKRKKRLTKKQAAVLRARLKNPNASQREIGDGLGMSQPHVARALALPHVQERMQALMDLHPETSLEGLHAKLVKGLNAKKTEFFAYEGEVQDEVEVEDNGTQFRYFEKAADMRGLLEKRVKISLDAPPPMSLAEARRLVQASPKVIEGETA